jgi:hypothetical protein
MPKSVKLFYFVLLGLLMLSFYSKGQSSQISNACEVAMSTSDRTYVSFGQGFGNNKTPYGVQRLKPLIFEGAVSPLFYFSLSKEKNMGFAFFPKVIVRMYNEPSVPVRTPSYMPSILFYHSIQTILPKKIFRNIRSEKQFTFMTYRLSHHSNGQNGPYYIGNTDSINYENGNFSTNSVEVALSWSSTDSSSKGKFFINGRISYERQLDFERESNLKDNYYYNKISIENRFIYSERLKTYVIYSFMTGTKHFGTRHSIDVYCAFKIFHKLSDFSIFIRAYAGPDYYNLYYENSLRTISIGIIADPLSIPIFKKKK